MTIKVGHNLQLLLDTPDASADLIYLDPPTTHNKDYNVCGAVSDVHLQVYRDTWSPVFVSKELYDDFVCNPPDGAQKVVTWLKAQHGILGWNREFSYIVTMIPLLWQCRRILTNTGCIWFHCNPLFSHQARTMLDVVFGSSKFCSEVFWRRAASANNTIGPGQIHDTLFFYSKTDKFTWNPTYHKPTEASEKHDGIDPDGRKWRWRDTFGPDKGYKGPKVGSRVVWRGVDPTLKRCCWSLSANLKDNYLRVTGKPLEGTTEEMLEKALEVGFIKLTARPRYKCYMNEGTILQSLWSDVYTIPAAERVWVEDENATKSTFNGQKPLALLERIIRCSSNVGDVVLDPFLGSGTTAVAAQSLNRAWSGIELTKKSSEPAASRLSEIFGERDWYDSTALRVPTDLEDCKRMAKDVKNFYALQCFAVQLLKGTPTPKQAIVMDGNHWIAGFSDGVPREAISEVKSGGVDVRDVRAFVHLLRPPPDSEKPTKYQCGFFIAFKNEITPGMKDILNQAGTYRTGDPADSRTFPIAQPIYWEDFWKPDVIMGGLRIPSYFIFDQTQVTARQQRHQYTSLLNAMADLPQE